MINDPFSPLLPFYAQLIDFILWIGDIIPDVFTQATKYAWTAISFFFLYKSVKFWERRKVVENRRKEVRKNGLYKIRSLMWVGLSSDFIQQALAVASIGVLAVLTPVPVRAQLTLLTIATSLTFIFILWKSYSMVSRVNKADQDSIQYARTHKPHLLEELEEEMKEE